MDTLTKKQQLVFDFVSNELARGHGFPSLSVIGSHFGFSRNTAKFHLHALERKGLLNRDHSQTSPYSLKQEIPADGVELVANIAAGGPQEAFEERGEFIQLNSSFFAKGDVKALVVQGQSMLGDLITQGDLALVQLQKQIGKNDIAAIRIQGEGLTLKRIRKNGRYIELIPSNPEFSIQSYLARDVEILGKLVGVVRRT